MPPLGEVMDKLIAQKPVVWNAHGYVRPAGSRSTGGFVTQTGYGHEEWNGNPKRVWRGNRVFHTQSKRQMDEFAEEGRLGILMTAYHEGRPYVVGAAVGVFLNTASEMRAIAKALKIEAEGDRMWREVAAIREGFGSRAKFDQHWSQNHVYMQWRAPSEQFVWFDRPVPIDVCSVFGGSRNDIAKMHSGCMYIRPDQASAMLATKLAEDSPIQEWFTTGTFEVSKSNRDAPKARRRRRFGVSDASASSPTEEFIRYMREYEVRITPRHTKLQERFRAYVSHWAPVENVRRVDIRFSHPQYGDVLAEVKPCEAGNARYAIRLAMGQLMDYQQHEEKSRLMIVLECQPSSDVDVSLATSNGFSIAWPTKKGWCLHWNG